jgi:predicted RNA-binding Zn ribbon-like protein
MELDEKGSLMLCRPPALFVGGAPALDFLNSVATLAGKPLDWLADGDGLFDWLRQAALVPEADLKALRADALPGELDSVAAQARSLREWFRAFVKARKGSPLRPVDAKVLVQLNRLLERDEGFKRVVPTNDSGRPMELLSLRRWKSAESVLLPIGEMLARFVCEENFYLVRACQAHDCTLMFVDHTRRRDRRWCSMSICGNRAKQREFRDRKKARS